MVVNGHGQGAFGFLLTDDILIQERLDLSGLLQGDAFRFEALPAVAFTKLLFDDKMGLLGAAVANLGINALNEQTDIFGFPATKRTNA